MAGTATNLVAPLEQIAATVRKRGMVVLISDLLAPPEALSKNLRYLRSQGHEVIVLRVLDPAEIEFRFDHAAMFVDLESGRDLYVDPAAAREEYLRNMQRHGEAVTRICQELGIEYFQTSTTRPLELALFDFLRARLHVGRRGREPGVEP